MDRKRRMTTQGLAYAGLMIALVFVSNYLSIKTPHSRLHVANAICLLAGMIFGGPLGGLIAGLGSAFYDFTFPAYVAESWVTFINKGAMALACGIIVNDRASKLPDSLRAVLGAVTGALLYVTLYLFKSYVQMRWVTPVPPETIPITLIEKGSSSLINGLFAVIVAPLLYGALKDPLRRLGVGQRAKG